MQKTLEQRWKEDITLHRKKCQKILLSSKSIRYVGLINEYGRTLTGIIKQGAIPLLKAGQVKNEFFIISTMLSMRRSNYSAIGEIEFAILKHKKVTILVFQRKEGTYYISIDKNATLDVVAKLIAKVKKII